MGLICDGLLETAPNFNPQSNLFSAGLDSMAIMQLLLAIEEEFGIEIPVASVSRKNFETVEAVARLVSQRLNGGEIEAPCCRETAQTAPREAPACEVDVPPAPVVIPPVAAFAPSPLRHCDYFVYCFHQMSCRTGQGGHKAHSILSLDRLPQLDRLRDTLRAAANAFPMMTATLHRRGGIGPHEWRQSARVKAPAIFLYSEEGSPGRLLAEGAERVSDVPALLDRICNTPMPRPERDMWEKARFSVIETRDGGATLVFSWSHLMCDGVGAEFFLQELERIASGSDAEPMPQLPGPMPDRGTLKQRWEAAKPIIFYFRELVKRKFDCLGPRKPTPGQTHFEVHTLSEAQSRRAAARCEALGCSLVSAPFHLACAMRAHQRVFARRGLEPPTYVCSVPVQTRRKGARGPIFQNHLTMFFGTLRAEELASLEAATALLMEQHGKFVKEKLGDALNNLMHSMRVMPSRLYMAFVSRQMRGPVATFFHSNTGEFAAGMNQFLGARILNAWHVPGIATPPGTGIFCNEKNGRLVVTLCWHENALSLEERRMMMESFLRDIDAL